MHGGAIWTVLRGGFCFFLLSAVILSVSCAVGTCMYNKPGEKNIRKRDWRVPVEGPSQLWGLHIGNAFEQRDGDGNLEVQLHVSGCSYQRFNFQKMFGYNWRSGKLDPSFMNVAEGEEKLLPHLIKVEKISAVPFLIFQSNRIDRQTSRQSIRTSPTERIPMFTLPNHLLLFESVAFLRQLTHICMYIYVEKENFGSWLG